jgi:acyl-coenzyme A thioesterase PaaI-like protein
VRVVQDNSSRQMIAGFTHASRDTIVGRMGITILEAAADRVVGAMPVEGNTQPHHRGVAAGTVTGVATQLHGGRTVASYEIVISDDHGRRVCTARLTCVLSDRVPGGGRPMATADPPAAPAT